MVAAGDCKASLSRREDSRLNIFDVSSVDAQWNVVLGLAGDRAGMATDALAIVNDKTVVHSSILLPILTFQSGIPGRPYSISSTRDEGSNKSALYQCSAGQQQRFLFLLFRVQNGRP